MDSDIEILRKEIVLLKEELSRKEDLLFKLVNKSVGGNIYSPYFSSDEITRYSRQIIMPDFNIEGQCSLKSSRALIVGVGGLGCPAALYLAAAGIGNLTLLDYDTVELTNLHRQVLHYECDIGVPKVESAYKKLKSINHNINIEPINLHVNSMTIEELLKKNKFDVVLDCTDNVATRYLLNDICVLYKIPLVSGSALQFEGQLTVYNYKNGPCYRCLFPVPPPPDSVTSCGDGGVLGAVPGTIGVLQALEAIKVIQNSSGVLSARLLLFDGSTTTFRNVKLRGRSKVCAVCGDDPTVTSLIDYEQFCGSSAHDKVNNIHILQQNQNIDFRSLSLLKDQLILDVRPEIEYNMCKLPNTHNIPYSDLLKGKNLEQVEALLKNARNNVYVLCRRGNDSQRAIVLLKEKFGDFPLNFINVSGGLHSYSKHIDSGFPVY